MSTLITSPTDHPVESPLGKGGVGNPEQRELHQTAVDVTDGVV
jgi:hypothetical protein